MLRRVLGWEPRITLEEGLARTYPWIEQQVASQSHMNLGHEVSVS
jgi:hypothetical protein